MSLENMSRWPQTTPSDRSQVSSAKGAARPHDSCYPSWNPKWSWSNCRIMKHEIYYICICILYMYYIYYILYVICYILYIILYIYYIIYIYTSLGGWCLPEIHGIPCRTAICCVLWVHVLFLQTANIQNIVISYVSRHFCAYLLRFQNHLLKHVLKIPSAIYNVSNCWLVPQQITRLWKSTNITNPKKNRNQPQITLNRP